MEVSGMICESVRGLADNSSQDRLQQVGAGVKEWRCPWDMEQSRLSNESEIAGA